MWKLKETVPQPGNRHRHTAIKVDGFNKRLVLMFTDTALTWFEGAIIHEGWNKVQNCFWSSNIHFLSYALVYCMFDENVKIGKYCFIVIKNIYM